jgi:integrase/recombinase XerD
VKEAVELWKEDVREKSLLVRGTRLREVPLSPFAQEVLWDWLPQRNFLASHQPLPYPHLLLKPAPGKARGKPLGLLEAKWILKEFAGFAGLKPKDKQRADLVLALRWRAIRRFLKEGHPREKVAYWTGMKSLVVPGWGEE